MEDVVIRRVYNQSDTSDLSNMEAAVEYCICLVQTPQMKWPSLGTVQSGVLFGISPVLVWERQHGASDYHQY